MEALCVAIRMCECLAHGQVGLAFLVFGCVRSGSHALFLVTVMPPGTQSQDTSPHKNNQVPGDAGRRVEMQLEPFSRPPGERSATIHSRRGWWCGVCGGVWCCVVCVWCEEAVPSAFLARAAICRPSRFSNDLLSACLLPLSLLCSLCVLSVSACVLSVRCTYTVDTERSRKQHLVVWRPQAAPAPAHPAAAPGAPAAPGAAPPPLLHSGVWSVEVEEEQHQEQQEQ